MQLFNVPPLSTGNASAHIAKQSKQPTSARANGKGAPNVERVNVICNGVKAEFMIHTQTIVCRCPTCTETGTQGSRAMSPTEFERHSGMQASKKWRRSIKVDLGSNTASMSLGRWLEQNGFKSSTPAGMTPPVVMPGAGGGLGVMVMPTMGGMLPLQTALLQQQMAIGLQGLPAPQFYGLNSMMGLPGPSPVNMAAAAAMAAASMSSPSKATYSSKPQQRLQQQPQQQQQQRPQQLQREGSVNIEKKSAKMLQQEEHDDIAMAADALNLLKNKDSSSDDVIALPGGSSSRRQPSNADALQLSPASASVRGQSNSPNTDIAGQLQGAPGFTNAGTSQPTMTPRSDSARNKAANGAASPQQSGARGHSSTGQRGRNGNKRANGKEEDYVTASDTPTEANAGLGNQGEGEASVDGGSGQEEEDAEDITGNLLSEHQHRGGNSHRVGVNKLNNNNWTPGLFDPNLGIAVSMGADRLSSALASPHLATPHSLLSIGLGASSVEAFHQNTPNSTSRRLNDGNAGLAQRRGNDDQRNRQEFTDCSPDGSGSETEDEHAKQASRLARTQTASPLANAGLPPPLPGFFGVNPMLPVLPNYLPNPLNPMAQHALMMLRGLPPDPMLSLAQQKAMLAHHQQQQLLASMYGGISPTAALGAPGMPFLPPMLHTQGLQPNLVPSMKPNASSSSLRQQVDSGSCQEKRRGKQGEEYDVDDQRGRHGSGKRARSQVQRHHANRDEQFDSDVAQESDYDEQSDHGLQNHKKHNNGKQGRKG